MFELKLLVNVRVLHICHKVPKGQLKYMEKKGVTNNFIIHWKQLGNLIFKNWNWKMSLNLLPKKNEFELCIGSENLF